MGRTLTEVRDQKISFIRSQIYDLRFFASGFESRCTAIPRLLRATTTGDRSIALGFLEHTENPVRLEADLYYREELGIEPLIALTGKPGTVAEILDNHFQSAGEECRILVDITSMSRSWYADIINWARFTNLVRRVHIDFCYMSGAYPSPYPSRAINEVVSLFGFEGWSDINLETLAIIGLGYDPITPHAVLEDLQPEWTFGYIAGGADEHSMLNALRVNAATIDELDGPVTVVPLLSVESAFSMLSDMIAPHAGNRNIVLVALGPKTHVLASLLVGTRNEEVTCLHVHGRSINAADITANGDMAACSVTFETHTSSSDQITTALEVANS